MLFAKVISIVNKAYVSDELRKYQPLFIDKVGSPVELVWGYETDLKTLHTSYTIGLKRRNNLFYDLVSSNILVRCRIIVNTERPSAMMTTMKTARGYRKKGLQELLQAMLYTMLQLREVTFIVTKPKGQRFVQKCGLFKDIQITYPKAEPDVFCRIDLEKCRTLIEEHFSRTADQKKRKEEDMLAKRA